MYKNPDRARPGDRVREMLSHTITQVFAETVKEALRKGQYIITQIDAEADIRDVEQELRYWDEWRMQIKQLFQDLPGDTPEVGLLAMTGEMDKVNKLNDILYREFEEFKNREPENESRRSELQRRAEELQAQMDAVRAEMQATLRIGGERPPLPRVERVEVDDALITEVPNPVIPATKNDPSRQPGRDTPPSATSGLDDTTANAVVALAKMLSGRSAAHDDILPRVEPKVYSGDALDFPVWWNSFETLVEARRDDPRDRMLYLHKYTSSEVSSCFAGFMGLADADLAYQLCRTTLQAQYGSKLVIAEAYRNKLQSWPKIKEGDGASLSRFSSFLWQCESIKQNSKYLEILDSQEENVRLANKLPTHIFNKWSREVDKALYGKPIVTMMDICEPQGEYPQFSRFCAFVANEARVSRGPCRVLGMQQKNNSVALATAATKTQEDRPYRREGPYKPRCSFCREEHHLYQCADFLNQSVADKKAYAIKRGLCFGCLRRNHKEEECWIKNSSIMTEPIGVNTEPPQASAHVTNAAPEQSEQEYPPTLDHATSMSTSTDPEEAFTMILPVWVSLKSDPDRRVVVFAAVDSQADSTFITEDLAEHLEASENPVDLKLTTMNVTSVVKSNRVNNLYIQGQREEEVLEIKKAYTMEEIPVDIRGIPSKETLSRYSHLKHLTDTIRQPGERDRVHMLIGYNCAKAFKTVETCEDESSSLIAFRSTLGWSVMGQENNSSNETKLKRCFRTSSREITHHEMNKAFDLDYAEPSPEAHKISYEDTQFLKIMEEGIRQEPSGHFSLPLPMRKISRTVPDSRPHAVRCLRREGKKMKRDGTYKKQYSKFMGDLPRNGWSERVPEKDLKRKDGKKWYWSHRGIKHPRKPNEVRGVFNGSASIDGFALNDYLMPGPDLTNTLVGVLTRFRLKKIPVTCDVFRMFFQVYMHEEFRDWTRYLWFENDDPDGEIVEFRMTVHLFGASSSPGCANYALKEAARRYEDLYGALAADFVRDNFYVDDGLGGADDPEEAEELIVTSDKLCKAGGFDLRKYTCGDPVVAEKIPEEKRAKSMAEKEINLAGEQVESTLGIELELGEDKFRYRMNLKPNPTTRRGMLSSLSAVFDPLGLVSPLLLQGRIILQKLCEQKFDWDDPVPKEIEEEWNKWLEDLGAVPVIKVTRCVRCSLTGEIVRKELHTFTDASLRGLGVCIYLLLMDAIGTVEVHLLQAKSKVTPVKKPTMPRLELQAAVLGARLGATMAKEIKMEGLVCFYHTDSKIVMGYILNETKKLSLYVNTRVVEIRKFTQPKDWRYVSTHDNPSDIASRGCTAQELDARDMWLYGPDFLRREVPEQDPAQFEIQDDDPEVKRESTKVTALPTRLQEPNWTLKIAEPISSWQKIVGVVGRAILFVHKILKQQIDLVESKEEAVNELVKAVQAEAYGRELQVLSRPAEGGRIADKQLQKLTPYLDAQGVMRVQGRLSLSGLTLNEKHPRLMPKDHQLTKKLIRYAHEAAGHPSANWTMSKVRRMGFWVVQGRAAAYNLIMSCPHCSRFRGKPNIPLMADVPEQRAADQPPFTYSATDLFGPFEVKIKRSREKRWICLFVCMSCRAIHLEIVASLDVSSFLMAFRRFTGRRGPVRALWCDRGTNFVAAERELKRGENEQEAARRVINDSLERNQCQVVEFNFGTPRASHTGGSWERMIRTVRAGMSHALQVQKADLTEEIFKTIVVEAEHLVNARPMTYVSDADTDQPMPLSPQQVLTMKREVVAPPPGKFAAADCYLRRKWRYTQYLVEQFWFRWRREWIPMMMQRQKWTKEAKPYQVGDVVIVIEDESKRGDWPLGRVVETFPGRDGRIRKVKVLMRGSEYERSVHKLILLREDLRDIG